jgi:hypothetical protein
VAIRSFLDPATLSMGVHVATDRVRRAVRGHRRYPGTADEVLRAALDACWTGSFLAASPGHYRQLWTRDLGFAAPALARLGHPHDERLLATIAWAVDSWGLRRSHVTTTIDPRLRRPVDLFDYGVDSLPLLLASLQSLVRAGGSVGERAEALVAMHEAWIAAEVEDFVRRVVDPATGLVRTDRTFSAHRDTFRNRSTAYANTMVALLGRTVAETGWGPDLLSRHFGGDWGSALRDRFWVGDRFRDRLGFDETSGEANVWPFYAGLVEDRAMLSAALASLRRDGYASPYPLRFAARHRPDDLLLVFRLFSADYQTTASWTSLGSIYVSLLREVDPVAAQTELTRMRTLVERDGTLWEVVDGRGRAWRSRNRLAITDESMLWGAILLETSIDADGAPLRLGRA